VTTEVTLPELGESVTEGTITAWLVEVGDQVEADQPLFELSSDKIDTEVPAPVGGVLKEIKVQVDETVDVGTVVAVIGSGDEDSSPEPGVEPEEAGAQPAPPAPPDPYERTEVEAAGVHEARDDTEPTGGTRAAAVPMSPLVRRMVTEHDLDVTKLSRTGKGGRITRSDVEAALSGEEQAPSTASAAPKPAARAPEPAPRPRPVEPSPGRQPAITAQPAGGPEAGARTRVEDLSRIRRRIAEKMMESQQSSAQLTTVQEADVTSIMSLRSRVKDTFRAREGASLSPFVFLCRAAVLAIRSHPAVNALADFQAGKVTYHDYVNLGIAVDTEKGLIVPNIKGADDLCLAGLARAIAQAADKARGRAADGARLEIADLQGGTFTMTNTGSRGVLIDTPILNYPEAAILGTGAIKKRPVVVEDRAGPAIAVRDMVYLCLTYDHRLIDGADAARFVTAVKEIVETHDWAAEIGYA
jgi:2-oxoglutarate dehydrogenase E2 component (dihydrolipoamide succinyltransferase)